MHRELKDQEYMEWKVQNDYLELDSEGRYSFNNYKGFLTADGQWLAVGVGGRWTGGLPVLVDPPANEMELWKRKRDFLVADVESTSGYFNCIKRDMVGGDTYRGEYYTSSVTLPNSGQAAYRWRQLVWGEKPAEGEDALLILKAHVEKAREAIIEMDANKPAEMIEAERRREEIRRQEAEANAEMQRRREENRQRLSQINL